MIFKRSVICEWFFFTLLLSVNLSKNMFFCVYHMMLHYIIWYSQCKEDLMIIDDQLSFIQRTHHFDIGNAEYSFCNDRWVKCEHNNEISYSTQRNHWIYEIVYALEMYLNSRTMHYAQQHTLLGTSIRTLSRTFVLDSNRMFPSVLE